MTESIIITDLLARIIVPLLGLWVLYNFLKDIGLSLVDIKVNTEEQVKLQRQTLEESKKMYVMLSGIVGELERLEDEAKETATKVHVMEVLRNANGNG